MLSPFLRRAIQIDPGEKWLGRIFPLDPLSGHLGILISQHPPLNPPFWEKISWLTKVLWVSAWILCLLRVFLLQNFSGLNVRGNLIFWLVGLAAIPFSLSIGANRRLESDIRFNRTEEMRQELLQKMGGFERGVKKIFDNYAQGCDDLKNFIEIKKKLTEARVDQVNSRKLADSIWNYFEQKRINLLGFYVFGTNGFELKRFSPSVSQDSKSWIRLLFLSSWNNTLRNQTAPQNTAGIFPSTPPISNEVTFGRAFLPDMKNSYRSEESGQSVTVGKKRVFMLKQFSIREKGKVIFQLFFFWSQAPLVQEYVKNSLNSFESTGESLGLKIRAYRVLGPTLREVSTKPESTNERLEWNKIAQKGRDKFFSDKGTATNDLVVAFPSTFLPDHILAGKISLDSVSDLIHREWLRLWEQWLGLLISLISAGSLLAGWLANPIERMTAGIRRVQEGTLSVRVAENRGDELGQAGRTLDRMTLNLWERREMSRFVSPQVLEVVAAGDFGKAMAGIRREVVILSSDIRNFTTISETHGPRLVFSMLNSHLERMTEAIQSNGGVIDRFIGDAIVAVFYPQPNIPTHQCALQAAVEMRKEHCKLVESRKSQNLFSYEIGVGLEEGWVVTGVVGDPETRLDFSVLGEPVQLAADLEGSSKKGSHTRIMVSSGLRKKLETSWEFVQITDEPGSWELDAKALIQCKSNFNRSEVDNSQDKISRKDEDVNEINEEKIQSDFSLKKTFAEVLDSFPKTALYWGVIWLFPAFLIFSILQAWETEIRERLHKDANERVDEGLRLTQRSMNPQIQASLFFNRLAFSASKIANEGHDGTKAVKNQVVSGLQKISRFFPNLSWHFFSYRPSSKDEVKFSLRYFHEIQGSGPANLSDLDVAGLVSPGIGYISSNRVLFPEMVEDRFFSKEVRAWMDERLPMILGCPFNHEFSRITIAGLGNLTSVMLKGKPSLFMWAPIFSGRKKVIGGFLLFLPFDSLNFSTGIQCMVENLRFLGLERKKLPKGFLSKQVTQLFDRQYRVTVAKKVEDPPHETSVVIQILKNLFLVWLISGFFLFPLNLFFRVSLKISLVWQLVAVFFIAMIPSLSVCLFTLERSNSERTSNIIEEGKKELDNGLRAFDEGFLLHATQLCRAAETAFHDTRMEEMVSEGQKKRDMGGFVPTIKALESAIDRFQWLGLGVRNIDVFGLNGFLLSTEIKRERAEAVCAFFEKSLSALSSNPQNVQMKKPTTRQMFIQAEMDELGNALRSVLPAEEFSSFLMAPRSFIKGELGKEKEEQLIYLNHLSDSYGPRWVVIIGCTSLPIVAHLLSEWVNLKSSEANSFSKLDGGKRTFPSWKLASPYFLYDYEKVQLKKGQDLMGFKNWEKTFLCFQDPEICEVKNWSCAAEEPIYRIIGPKANKELISVRPSINGKPFIICNRIPILKLLEPTHETILQERFGIGVFVLFSLLLAIRVSHRFLAPLHDFIITANRFGRGDFRVSIPVTREDEFG
ncbi:HAMP domain-containing protein [bacterium]|nr:HAMP domain-containing protein [bacterium]